jgi:error-prone DNA polymerase
MPETENPKLYNGCEIDPPKKVAESKYHYAELDVTTNFSFLHGASHPDELVYTAALLGYRALAVTDINTLAGVVRMHEKARAIEGFRLIIGARLVFNDFTPDVLVWPTDRAAYSRLCRLITLGRRRAPKGECHIGVADFLDHSDGMLAAISPQWPWDREMLCHQLRDAMGDRLSLAVHLCRGDDDKSRLECAADLSRRTQVPLLATNHVHYHDAGRRPLQDVLTCVRHGCTVPEAGFKLFPNAERYLKSPRLMNRLFSKCPQAIERGLEIADRCRFSLDELRYDYPTEVVPAGRSPSRHLRKLTWQGARQRYPDGVPISVREQLKKELKFICHSEYESYFLTVHDLVMYARSKGILCQGRGSAANSAVCYCLAVTAVDPTKFQLVFERFASDERSEPPDIDIDFEHERREEVIQYVYEKYGRTRTAMTASLITYRGRSAVRDVGKALGFSQDTLDQLAGKLDWWHRGTLSPSQLGEAGIDPRDKTINRLITLTSELLGFPRHLSQHVGGMVISQTPLCDIVPIENASMEDRTVIEWDKDDLDVLKIFKVDILALGMLTCISKCLSMINAVKPRPVVAPGAPPLEMHTIPSEDPRVYAMISDADTVGVFQVESRAQMSMLPRLRPNEFYDLVIEVAIVRPGPIQGDMVHPYLKRRDARRADPNYVIDYQKPELEAVLHKTLGVPLFQEQAMKMAMVAAGFTGSEADSLRRGMAAWKRSGGLARFHDKFVNGMITRGYEPGFAQRCFDQICGFGEYGFPESHAASFAILVYVSAWLKRFHPAVFAGSLINSLPMGFYAPAQIIRDAREHGVIVLPIDVNSSSWDCTLEWESSSISPPLCGGSGDSPNTPAEPGTNGSCEVHKSRWGVGGPELRLGFRLIKGMRKEHADRIVAARARVGVFDSVAQLQHAADIDPTAIHRLAKADALNSIKLNRRRATWEAMALSNIAAPLFDGLNKPSIPAQLPAMREDEEVIIDYATTSLSLKKHPVSFARDELTRSRVSSAIAIQNAEKFPNGKWASVAGLVLVRQRPGTASGVVFITLEDETGVVNLILWARTYERYRKVARHATLLQCSGIVQREGQVIHILACRLVDRTELLSDLLQPSRDFH